MDMGAVDTVMISEDFNYYEATYKCGNDHEKQVLKKSRK